MKKIFLKSLFFTVTLFGVFSVFAYVFAQPDLGLEYGAQIGLGSQDIRVTIANIIRTALGLLGIVALVIVLWGGVMWMTAGGDENKVATAKKILINGVIGLAIIMSSWAITSFVISRLLQATVGIYPDHCYNGALDLDLGETGKDCGGPCPACFGPTDPNPWGGNYFKIKSVPLGGQLCVANYHPVITFNYPVNLETVQGKIRILDTQNNPIEGAWSSQGNGQVIVFSATGDCGDRGLDDCFPPNAPFTLDFTGANGNIESTDGKKLVCAPTPSTDKCLPIDFTTGSGVDRNAPTVRIFEPGNSIGQGDSPEIEIEVTDDIAVQNVSLYVAGRLVGSQSFDGCQQNVPANIIWNTASLQPGQLYTLVAEGLDQAAQVGNDSMDIRLLPAHCFDNVLDEGEEQVGPPACGGDCGACPGGACQYDHQCAGGLVCIQGTCTRVMRILGIDPKIGVPKNYMGIFGENFGTTPGTVWFSKVAQPNKDTPADWSEAQIVTCGTDTKNWFNDQIVVEVPEDFNKDQAGAAIMVSGNGFVANTIGDGTDIYSRNLRFKYDSALANRPSLCMVNPNQFSSFQNNIRYVGKEFGTYNSGIDRVYLNVSNDVEDKLAMTVNTWGMVSGLSQVQTQAPRLENGSLTTYVLADNVKSNSLRVRVSNTFDSTAPIIDNITPNNGAKGEYITITGNNFGSQKGSVRFYKKPVTSLANNSQYFEGGFDFMDECLDGFWTDKKIIVKIPKTIDLSPDIGDYAVVVFNSKGQNSVLQNNVSFNLENTTPKPSICKVKPASGPVNSGLDIYGENFGTNKENLKIYFWKNGAVMSSFDNRASTTPQTLTNIKGGQQLTGVVPFDAMSGELLVERSDLQNGFSNPLNFTVKDCTNPGESCATGEKCCSGGDEKGVCKPVNELCLGEIRSTGYMWRFTTKTFPKAPKVVVRCSPDDSTVPTPAPNVALNPEAISTCLTADVTVEITTNINSTTVNNSSFRVYECAEGPAKTGDNLCKSINATAVTIGRQVENNSDVALITGSVLDNNNKWQPDKWYQVVLTQDIRSDDATRPQKLEATNPCNNVSGINNTAYCFVFQTGDKDCVLSSVAVNPSSYTTKFLETPVLNRKNKNDRNEVAPPFYFKGIGIGDHCIAMNMSGYAWSWNAVNSNFANIFGATNMSSARVSSLVNTIGASGVSDDSAKFAATASKGSNSKTGSGALVIDLTNPEIIDYAPNCLTACTNADVFAKFNLPMSNSFSVGSVQLLECRDGADCTNTQLVSNNFSFTQSSGYQNLELNFGDLATNTFYIVQITSGTLFTAGSSTNNAIIGSPFKQNFAWRFRTKDKICTVDRINVLPKIFNAYFVGAKTIYNAEAYSSPDECSTEGQKLKSTDYNWSWVSLSPQVATTTAYKIIGKNSFCTSNCLKRGSVISSGVYDYDYPMCGNSKVEAGEDCDPPGVNCGLNCLFINKSKIGSLSADKVDPKDINAPVCGDRKVSSQEDCDLDITASSTQSSSSMFCSTDCLHTGTRLSSKWCSDNYVYYHTQQSGETSASFTLRKKDFENSCALAISQCGNDVIEPDEDCEGGSNCNSSCLFIDKNKIGSSLFENPPSVCGDGSYTSNEDAYCESQLFGNNNFTSPWALTTAIGEVFQAENPVQTTQIRATLTSQNKTDFGVFNLICGYTTDEQCQAAIGADYGVGKNSCCYPRLSVSSTYPEDEITDVCPNTEIKISFDDPIDPNTLSGNLIIAKDYKGVDSPFCTGTQIIADSSSENQNNLAWYQKIWKITFGWLQKLFGTEKAIAQWCTGETVGTSKVIFNSINNNFDIVIQLEKALTGNTTSYKILLTNGIKDDRGVSIVPHEFTFTTWKESDVCKVGAVTLEPDKVFFTETNSSTALLAAARATSSLTQTIQPTSDYSWEYIWSKDRSNSFVVNTETTGTISYVTSTNQNGEGEVYVTVATTDPKDSRPTPAKSKITVNLCENPWPPFVVNSNNVWPFEDTANNNDGFDFSLRSIEGQTGFTGNSFSYGSYTNFSTHYCADSGVSGIKDDLPYMNLIVSSTQEANIIKYFLLTNNKNADAIGIKIFTNLEYRTLKEWLEFNTSTRGLSFNYLKIDGYEAAVDQPGNNVYITALNIASPVYSNIYLFNLSKNANSETKQVFDQMITNLKFNINFLEEYNLKMCASGYDWSSAGTLPEGNCNTDLDCLNVADKPVCLNQKEKMQRNYQRIQDARFVSTSLASYYNDIKNNYKYPNITQTYLPDRAMSIWQSSWVELGSKLGKPLPLDPINKLAPAGTCFLNSNDDCIQNFDCGDGTVPGATGQIGYWAGENNFEDSTASTSRKNNAIGQGSNFAPGVGKGLSFNFPTGFEKILIKHQDEHDIDLENFAISFWFKPTEQTPAILIKKGGWSDTAPNNTLGGFMVEYNKLSFTGTGNSPIANNGTIRFAIFPSSTDPLASNQYFAIDTNDPLVLNKWHHILVRYATGGTMYMLVDGVQYNAVKKGSSPHTAVSESDIKIGNNEEDIIIGEGLKGQMDEIYLYARTGLEGTEAAFNSRFENICHLHDSQTGWSAEGLRLSFACAEKSSAYGYKTSDNNYVFRTTLENENIPLANWDELLEKFGLKNSPKFIIDNFCEDTIVSGASGLCGNGVVNAGEECDYAGEQYSGYGNCSVNGSGGYTGNMTKSVCNNCLSVSNSTVSCATVATKLKISCGDGKVQTNFGEICDNGDKNGSPLDLCGTNCQLVAQPICGNGVLDSGEYCDTDSDAEVCSFSSGITVSNYENTIAYFLIDISGSMGFSLSGKTAFTQADPSRWYVVTSTLPEVTQRLVEENVSFGASFYTGGSGSLLYNGTTIKTLGYIYEFLPFDLYTSNDIMDGLVGSSLPNGGTPTGQAINKILTDKFNDEIPYWKNSSKSLILITDGDPDNIDTTINAIRAAGRENIKVNIFGVGWGVESSEESSKMAEEAIKTGGVFESITNINQAQDFILKMLEAIKPKSCQEYSFKSGYSCAWNCKGPGGYCGDGKTNGPEQCDDGIDNGPNKRCNQYCQIETNILPSPIAEDSSCGDGKLTEEEIKKGYECDNGPLNGTACNPTNAFYFCSWCSSDCKIRWEEVDPSQWD